MQSAEGGKRGIKREVNLQGGIEEDSGWQEDLGRSLISGQRMGNWADLPRASRTMVANLLLFWYSLEQLLLYNAFLHSKRMRSANTNVMYCTSAQVLQQSPVI